MIQKITQEHLEEVYELGKQMHEESVYANKTWNEDKVRKLGSVLAAYPDVFFGRVAIVDNRIVGVLVGHQVEYFFGDDKKAEDLIFYVLPEYRGSSAAIRLLKEFESWAKEKGLKEIFISQSTGVAVEKTQSLFNKLGYTTVGYNTAKEI